jgi:hypothetical protein
VPIDDVYNGAGPAVVILKVNFEPDLFSVAQVGEETVFKCPYCEFAELDRCMTVREPNCPFRGRRSVASRERSD